MKVRTLLLDDSPERLNTFLSISMYFGDEAARCGHSFRDAQGVLTQADPAFGNFRATNDILDGDRARR